MKAILITARSLQIYTISTAVTNPAAEFSHWTLLLWLTLWSSTAGTKPLHQLYKALRSINSYN